ncbi:NAD-dependent epimerase/dehydratase family protein [Roseospira visakhapatnamensis]|uniref:GDP-L-fucose synthase n=1 Tax=Roseospira visakhapatnamensis TaxID=390880 RepID=A0A7W6RGM0_9PROT|nr:NAD(P)-dependent oxidoreductase [Roseospira visakhapatnamensis]MBB4267478.1 GDP-L-fucose synthase [Roseospira visakhapatnamensis]
MAVACPFLDETDVLVTGGTGLGGSAVVRHLLDAAPGVRVRVPHRGEDGAFLDDPRVTYVRADLTDPDAARAVADGCRTAVLAAARTGGAADMTARPWEQARHAVALDMAAFEALAAHDVERLVYVSTATVYADDAGALSEDDLDLNRDPAPAHFGIAWAKRYGESLARLWRRTTGHPCCVLRLANIYGPHARFDPQRSNFVAALVRKAVERQDPFVIWGAPEVSRDILHVDDFARAVVALLGREHWRDLETDADARQGALVLNIGAGRTVTVGEVAAWACRAAGHAPGRIVHQGQAPTTLGHRRLDCGRAERLLGWRAEISPEDGIGRTVAWWRDNQRTWTR